MLKKLQILFIIFILTLSDNIAYAFSNDNYSVKAESEQNLTGSLPNIFVLGIGSLILLSSIILVILKKPESIGLSSETFIFKENLPSQNEQKTSIGNIFALNYNFGDIFELKPSVGFVKDKSPIFLSDFGVSFYDQRINEKEIYGISPFISAGLTGAFYDSSFGYGIYGKTGLMLRFQKVLFDFEIGYRFLELTQNSSNSFTFGGNIMYKFE